MTALRCRRRLPCRGIRYRPTGKELDTETGLYYFGARYLDPKTARWISGDPAISEYIPSAPVSDEAKKRNGSLPGMGGVFNVVNLHVYHYAGNNPVKYEDPTGRDIELYGTPEEQKEILDLINEYSHKQYAIDENGKLYATDKTNNKISSREYSDYLDRGIANADSTTIVHLVPEGGFIIDKDTPPVNLNENGGGYTSYMVDANGTVSRYRIGVAITGNPGLDSTLGTVPATDVLMHELMGHSIPLGLGGMDHINALDIDNIARSQLGLKQRSPDPKHLVRHGR